MAEEEEDPNKLCFVVGPIGTEDSSQRIHADWLLEFIIQPVMDNYPQFETQRADQIATPGMIDAQVIKALLDADLVIADLSTLNPNAFYEIGIRHMAQKPIIHMQITEENIPFDVSLYRAIKYSRTRPSDIRAAQAALRSQIEAVLQDGYQVENPVTRTRGAVQLQQHATPEKELLFGQIQEMQGRMDNLEHLIRASNDMAMRAMNSPPIEYAPIWPNDPREVRNLIVHGRITNEKPRKWEFIVDIEPTHETRVDEIIDGILKFKTRSEVVVTGQNTLKIIAPGPGPMIQQFMNRVRQLVGVKSVHSAEAI